MCQATAYKTLLAAVVAIALAACAGGANSCPPAAAAPSRGAGGGQAADKEVLATFDGEQITLADLPGVARTRLDDLENEAEQRKLHATWAAVEEVVAERLEAKEAARQSITVEELRDKEVGAKLTPPSDEEVKRFYEENLAGSNIDFERAAPQIRSELMQQRFMTEERAFIDRLRVGAKTSYHLPVPELPRRKIDPGPGPGVGPANAKVTIVEFSDFQCPYCARASLILTQLRELYPNDVRIEYRDFPLQQHPRAERAAEAARCADEQQAFWPYQELLFANQRALEEADLLRYAGDAKLDVTAFQACLSSGRAKRIVSASADTAQRLGIDGTPAIFVNGIKLIGVLPLPIMQAIIDHEVGK